MMKLKFLVLTALLIAPFSWIALTGKKKTDDFTVAAIRAHRPYDARWEGHPLSAEEAKQVDEALGKSYWYYGCGGQSFIFFSDDEKWVLKFFKQKNFTCSHWLCRLPLPFVLDRYNEKKRQKKADKLCRDFTSYKTAFDALRPYTGVVYIHLNPTSHLKKRVTLRDGSGKAYHLNLDEFDFILQRKAEFVYDRINAAVKDGDEKKAKESISQVISFIVTRCKLGYHDRDPNIRTNCGFLDGKLVKIDVGRLFYNEAMKQPEVYKNELIRITAPFKKWLQEEHPPLLEHFEDEIRRVLDE